MGGEGEGGVSLCDGEVGEWMCGCLCVCMCVYVYICLYACQSRHTVTTTGTFHGEGDLGGI